MKLHVSFRHVDHSPSVVERLDKRARRLSERFDAGADVRALCELDSGQALVEVSAVIQGEWYRAAGRASDMYRAVDEAFDVLARQVGRHHERRVRARRQRMHKARLAA